MGPKQLFNEPRDCGTHHAGLAPERRRKLHIARFEKKHSNSRLVAKRHFAIHRRGEAKETMNRSVLAAQRTLQEPILL